MNNAVYGKTMENLTNTTIVKHVSNKKDSLKWTSKPSYMSHKIFDNNLVVIPKNKVPLTLNKSACIGMCILELRKLLMYKFHYDYIKNKCSNNSRLFITDSYFYCMKLKLNMSMKILAMIKKCLTLAIIQLSTNIMTYQTN